MLPSLCPRQENDPHLQNKCHLLLKAPPGSGRVAPVMNKHFAVAPLLGRRRQAGTAGSKAVRARAEELAGHVLGDTALFILFTASPGRRSPHRACKNTERKGEVIDAVPPGRSVGCMPQPGRSAVVLLHACQQSNTCQKTSPRPGLSTRPPHSAPAAPLTSLATPKERPRNRRALFYRGVSPAPLSRPIEWECGGTC